MGLNRPKRERVTENVTPPGLPGDPGSGNGETEKPWYRRWWVIALGVVVLIGIIANLGGDEAETEDPEAVATSTIEETTASTSPATEPSTTVQPTTTTTPATTTTTQATTTTTLPVISSGVYIVPTEFAPGLYRVVGYWARLDANQEIIDNDLVPENGMALLNVRDTDAFVEINGEAIAVADFNGGVADPILAGFTSGTYLVGIDIQPGQYRVTPETGSTAYFARLDANGEIIDNNLSEGQLIAQIAESDWAFSFTGTLERIEG
jgi:hypothetical protein